MSVSLSQTQKMSSTYLHKNFGTVFQKSETNVSK